MTNSIDEIILTSEAAKRLGKEPRQVRRLYGIHAGLKHQVVGEKEARFNMSLWNRIILNPNGYIKLVKKKK